MLKDWLRPTRIVDAHCDLPCGVYDPAQARIEAESVQKIQEKYADAENQKKPSETVEDFKTRCLAIKEERADLVKHHLWVLWTDYFKPEHLEKFPELHDTFWKATKAAGESKKSQDPAQGKDLLDAHRRGGPHLLGDQEVVRRAVLTATAAILLLLLWRRSRPYPVVAPGRIDVAHHPARRATCSPRRRGPSAWDGGRGDAERSRDREASDRRLDGDFVTVVGDNADAIDGQPVVRGGRARRRRTRRGPLAVLLAAFGLAVRLEGENWGSRSASPSARSASGDGPAGSSRASG